MSPTIGASTIVDRTNNSRTANASRATHANSIRNRDGCAAGMVPAPVMSIDPQLLQLVAQRAKGDAQRGGRLGLVVAVVLERLLDGVAFDFLDVARQRTGHAVARIRGARVADH